MQTYIQNNFPTTFVISKQQLQQLQLSIDREGHTRDMDKHVKIRDVHIEMQRALVRMYCLQLLRDGSRDSYNQFVAAQLQLGINIPLGFASFNKLAKHIQNLNDSDYKLIETVAGLQAITSNKLSEKLAHFRHMLYTEGGVAMFRTLRGMIRHGYLNQQELDLWYASWIINIAGFRGHVNPHGSLYLTEVVAQDMQRLKSLIYEMLDTPNFDPLLPYLDYRASLLGLRHLPNSDRLFITHLACLLRLYTPQEGQRLHSSIMQLPWQQRDMVRQYFLTGLQEPTQQPATYLPALFANAMAISNGDIDQVIRKVIPVYNRILKEYKISGCNNPLSFNQLSSSENVTKLLQATNEYQYNLIFNPDGVVLIAF